MDIKLLDSNRVRYKTYLTFFIVNIVSSLIGIIVSDFSSSFAVYMQIMNCLITIVFIWQVKRVITSKLIRRLALSYYMFIIMFGMWIGTGSVHPLFIAYAMMVVQVFLLTTDKSKRVYLLTAFIFSYLTLGFIDVFIRNIQIGTIGNLNIQSLISIASILLGSLLILHFNNIEVEELNSEIASIGFEDALTSAMNRHAFFEDIKRVESNHLNYKRDYAIVYMDVDDLKIINDSYGHAEGDKAIRTVVDVTKGLLRSNDGLYRFGGDEFVLLLENMDEKQLIHKLSEIDSKLLRHSGKYALSVSYGHAHRNNVFSYEAAMKIADTNMYKSKAHKKKYHKSIYANI